MKTTLLSAMAIILSLPVFSQNPGIEKEAFAHTYSIVARDSVTGEMAVGVQSHWFSVGPLVAWGKSGVGVVATQSFVNPEYGPRGLELMEEGKTAVEALEEIANSDSGREYRQVAFLDSRGNTAAFTGQNCVEAASHITEKNFSVQANMMLNDETVPAMAESFSSNSHLPLAERVLEALKAAQETGGDIRGKQSAALIVVGANRVEESWKDKKIDLRVDDHAEPIKELERLLKTARAYEYMNRGDLAMEDGDVDKALEEYGTAEKMFPDNLEMQFWKAVALANAGEIEEAKPVFDKIFKKDENWREMLRRLPKAGLLDVSDEELKQLTD
ncbi:DUF1028 domain-containing protein [Salegentibacter sediminis]|uniref:DUF1028 domain-containing protein n=1 Tax=Salegentibacter sediminis TaxID=1930251 RepID=UPI0009C09C72|nr:DUF1028 domain-containing protein [Salegentibacter sediminis]